MVVAISTDTWKSRDRFWPIVHADFVKLKPNCIIMKLTEHLCIRRNFIGVAFATDFL